MDAEHVPVLAAQALRWLGVGAGGLFVDCTVGLGGHAERLLAADPAARLLGVDRDPQALAIAAERLAPFGDRVELVAGRFGDLGLLLEERGLGGAAGILADLGLSSLQLDRGERGFSFRFDAPLDMRMEGPGGASRDRSTAGGEPAGGGEMSAADVINGYPEEKLEQIFREYGEEKQARRIARAVVAARPLETTGELADLVRRSKGRRPGPPPRIDPATQVFQALRIEVNQELDQLEELLRQAVGLLAQDGHLVVISYHSLEDRIVKHTLRKLGRGEVDRITGRPLAETRLIEVLTKKPVRPDEEEVALNPRSRSARLRAARRL